MIRPAFFLLSVVSVLSTATLLPAQEEPASRVPLYWKACLPGGNFIVPLSSITSISQSQYVVDGSMRVTEVSVGTIGSVQGRFYYVEPLTPQSPLGVGQSTLEDLKSRIEEVADRTGGEEVWSKVIKNYPTTTHAHTVEFRLASAEQLAKLYQSLENSFLRRRTVEFKP